MSDHNIKGILCDLDMTLSDSLTAKKEAVNAALDAMLKAGLKIDKDKARALLKEEYTADLDGPLVISSFLEKHAEHDHRLLAPAINAYRKAKIKHTTPYEGVKETLEILKEQGFKLAIVTDTPSLKAHRKLDAIGVLHLFDEIICREHTNKKKPEPEPFQEALKKLNLKADEVLFIGDWLERDIKGAKNLGILSVHACWDNPFSKEGCDEKGDFEIHSFPELLKVLESLKDKT